MAEIDMHGKLQTVLARTKEKYLEELYERYEGEIIQMSKTCGLPIRTLINELHAFGIIPEVQNSARKR